MKPPFLLSAGTSYSATTPLYFTLAKQQKYCHAGTQKENGYLKLLNLPDYRVPDYIRSLESRGRADHAWIRMVDDRDFVNEEETKKWLSPPYNLDEYVSYYLRHYERIKGTYHAVTDFTNHNFELPEDFLIQLRDALCEHFDVRVTFIFRDPIRRYYSEVGKFIQHNVLLEGSFDAHKLKHNAYVKRKAQNSLFLYYLQNQQYYPTQQHVYVPNIQKFERVFGKERVLPIIMEELWHPERQAEVCEKLSSFLDYEITSVHENAYYPDKGSHAPHYEGLSDQWGSDVEDITPQTYEEAKQYLGYVYQDWERCYETLPEEWNSLTSSKEYTIIKE